MPIEKLGFYEEGGVSIQDLQNCMGSAKGSERDFVQAIQLWLDGSDDIIWNHEEAKRILRMGLQLAKDALKQCSKSYREVLKFQKSIDNAIQLINQPKQFAQHIMEDAFLYQSELEEEYGLIKIYWYQKDSTQLGQSLGRAFYQLGVGIL